MYIQSSKLSIPNGSSCDEELSKIPPELRNCVMAHLRTPRVSGYRVKKGDAHEIPDIEYYIEHCSSDMHRPVFSMIKHMGAGIEIEANLENWVPANSIYFRVEQEMINILNEMEEKGLGNDDVEAKLIGDIL